MLLPENTEQAKREACVSPDSAPRYCSLACPGASMKGRHLLLEEGRWKLWSPRQGMEATWRQLGRKEPLVPFISGNLWKWWWFWILKEWSRCQEMLPPSPLTLSNISCTAGTWGLALFSACYMHGLLCILLSPRTKLPYGITVLWI